MYVYFSRKKRRISVFLVTSPDSIECEERNRMKRKKKRRLIFYDLYTICIHRTKSKNIKTSFMIHRITLNHSISFDDDYIRNRIEFLSMYKDDYFIYIYIIIIKRENTEREEKNT